MRSWRTSSRPGLSQQLTADGVLVRAGNLEMRGAFAAGQGAGGRIEALSWEGQPLWQQDFADNEQMQHHEIDVMPNGNVLAIIWERVVEAEALAAPGRRRSSCPTTSCGRTRSSSTTRASTRSCGKRRVWDHLVQDRDPDAPNYEEDVSTRPERIDLNYVLNGENGQADWNHLNGVAYDAARDEIVLSSRSFSEFWVIDHTPTTEAARGPAGDLKFRYGNPIAYGDENGKRRCSSSTTRSGSPRDFRARATSSCSTTARPRSASSARPTRWSPSSTPSGDYVRDPDGGFQATLDTRLSEGRKRRRG